MVYRLLLFAFWPIITQAQKLENIRHDSYGSDIVINYDLTETLPSQQFLVKATCQNGAKAIELQSTEGNGIGRRVRGGAGRQIVWHVLPDVPELVGDKVTFTVTAVVVTALSNQEPGANFPVASTSVSDRKAALYNELTAQTDTYPEQVYNEVTVFKNFGERAFESRSDLIRLDQQVTRTNEAYEKLLQNKETFKQRIRSLWGSEEINADSDQFFSRSLDQMHRSYSLPFNDTLKRINDAASGKLKTRERNDTVTRIKIEIDILTRHLLQEIDSVKGAAKGFYANLLQ